MVRRILFLASIAVLCACSSNPDEDGSSLDGLDDFRQRATQYYSAGDLERAKHQAGRGLAIEPEDGMLNLIMGRTLLRKRDLLSVNQSIPYLDQANEELDDWRTHLSLGEGHLRYAEYLIAQAAILEFRSVELGGGDEEGIADMKRRAVHARSVADRHLTQSLPLLEQSERENPGYTFTLQLLATNYTLVDRDTEALDTLAELIEMLGESRRWKNRQLALQQLEIWQEDNLRGALRNDLRMEVEARGLVTAILMVQKDYSEAEKELTRILNLDNSLDREYFNRGICRFRQGKLFEASQDLEDFIRKTGLSYDSPQVEEAMEILAKIKGHDLPLEPFEALPAGNR